MASFIEVNKMDWATLFAFLAVLSALMTAFAALLSEIRKWRRSGDRGAKPEAE